LDFGLKELKRHPALALAPLGVAVSEAAARRGPKCAKGYCGEKDRGRRGSPVAASGSYGEEPVENRDLKELAKWSNGSSSRPRPCGTPSRDHAAALRGLRGRLPGRRSRNRCKGEHRASAHTAAAHPRDFEGPARNASGPGLTLRLSPRCEPRRRDRLPLAAMSEGPGYGRSLATLRLRPSDQRGPGRAPAAGPERADEGGGPTPGRLAE
jgi:hypothetical protein